MTFAIVVAVVGVLAGAIASVSGFGIGSFMTPLLALRIGTGPAVALISVPHFVGTAIRFWSLRRDVDRSVLTRFGIASAAGGLVGALGHAVIRGAVTSVVLGVVLAFAGLFGLTGVLDKVRLGRTAALVAGGVSGGFGGLVGNQGGVRSAALLAFDLPRNAFAATATAVALLVDLARVPVYAITTWTAVAEHSVLLASATSGVAVGTVVGTRVLRRVPERVFRRVVSGFVLVVGVLVVIGAVMGAPGLGDE